MNIKTWAEFNTSKVSYEYKQIYLWKYVNLRYSSACSTESKLTLALWTPPAGDSGIAWNGLDRVSSAWEKPWVGAGPPTAAWKIEKTGQLISWFAHMNPIIPHSIFTPFDYTLSHIHPPLLLGHLELGIPIVGLLQPDWTLQPEINHG